MSKPIKDLISDVYKNRYSDLDSACVVSVIGLDAVATNKLRGQLHEKEISLQVVKNSLARRAFTDSPLSPLGEALAGPCALVTGGSSIIDVAKTLKDMQKEFPNLELKYGIIEGDPDLVDLEQMAKMKGRDELLSDIAGLLISPAGRLAGCLQGPGGRLAGCLKAMAEKEEGESEAAA